MFSNWNTEKWLWKILPYLYNWSLHNYALRVQIKWNANIKVTENQLHIVQTKLVHLITRMINFFFRMLLFVVLGELLEKKAKSKRFVWVKNISFFMWILLTLPFIRIENWKSVEVAFCHNNNKNIFPAVYSRVKWVFVREFIQLHFR